ncbi:hypothetical protein MD484_g4748, partial [Candolleomyces efflorescens]
MEILGHYSVAVDDKNAIDQEKDAQVVSIGGAPSLNGAGEHEEEELSGAGFRGWVMIAGAFLIQFCGYGYAAAYGVFQDYYIRYYLPNASPSTISWIGSVNAFMSISMGLIVGVAYDKGYFGSLISALSLFMLSLAKPNQVWQCFLAQGIGMGLGTGLNFVPSVAIASQYFPRRDSSAVAMILITAGSPLGAIIHPIMLNKLLSNPDMSFGTAMRISAGFVTVLLAIACCCMRQRNAPPESPTSVVKVFAKAARDKAFGCMCISLLLFCMAFFYPMFNIQLDSVKHGVREGLAFYFLAIMNAGSFISGLLPTLFVRSIGVVNMVIFSVASTTALIFSMVALKDLASALVITILFGVCVGIFYGLQAPLAVALTEDEAEIGWVFYV